MNREPEKPIYIYFHICCIHNWKEIVLTLYNEIKRSGLYDKIDTLFCSVLSENGDDIYIYPLFNNDPKVQIIWQSTNLQLYERPTLHHLYDFCKAKTTDCHVLYIHSKGVRHNGQNPCVDDWVKYLTYFNITNHSACINALDVYDVVGVNLNEQPVPHFSGNFWWSKSSYIRTLERHIGEHYNDPEFWITVGRGRGRGRGHDHIHGRFFSFHNSNINHYTTLYPESEYLLL